MRQHVVFMMCIGQQILSTAVAPVQAAAERGIVDCPRWVGRRASMPLIDHASAHADSSEAILWEQTPLADASCRAYHPLSRGIDFTDSSTCYRRQQVSYFDDDASGVEDGRQQTCSCMCVCIYVCMYVCMHAYVYVCMHMCMYVYRGRR